MANSAAGKKGDAMKRGRGRVKDLPAKPAGSGRAGDVKGGLKMLTSARESVTEAKNVASAINQVQKGG